MRQFIFFACDLCKNRAPFAYRRRELGGMVSSFTYSKVLNVSEGKGEESKFQAVSLFLLFHQLQCACRAGIEAKLAVLANLNG